MSYTIVQDVAKYGNLSIYAKKFSSGATVNIRTSPEIKTGNLIYKAAGGMLLGKTTGQGALYSNGSFWMQFTSDIPSYKNMLLWVFYPSAQSTKTAVSQNTTATTSDAQALLDKIIKNDIILYHRMLLLYNGVMDMKKKGKDITPFQAKGLVLIKSYNERQTWIGENSSKIKKGYIPGFENTKTKYNSKFDLKGIGEITVGAVVLIVCIVFAIVGTAVAIHLLQPKYDESKANLKVCKELEDLLKTTDPETAEKIKEDLETQIDDAYNKGKKSQWWSDMGGTVKTVGIIALAALAFFWGVPKLMEAGKKNYKKASA